MSVRHLGRSLFRQARLEEVQDATVLRTGLHDLVAQQFVLEPQALGLVARPIEALLDHQVLGPVPDRSGAEPSRLPIALDRVRHAHLVLLFRDGLFRDGEEGLTHPPGGRIDAGRDGVPRSVGGEPRTPQVPLMHASQDGSVGAFRVPTPFPGRGSEAVPGAPSRAGDRSHPALSGFGQTCLVSTILVVDDEPAVRDALERALKAQHYTVATAADGRQALDAIAERGPDLVLLDVLMPVMDGFEACRRLREAGDRTPVLMLTARDTVGDRVEGLDAGADDYVVKPFALEELLARSRALLRRSGAPSDDRMRFADLELDPVSMDVRRANARSSCHAPSTTCSSSSS